jgi:hypothetical protein
MNDCNPRVLAAFRRKSCRVPSQRQAWRGDRAPLASTVLATVALAPA